MATKIIQDKNIPRVAPAVGIASTSVPIAMKSGYLRVTIGSTIGSSGGYIAIGTDPVANQDNFHITSYSVDIVKETMKRQRIAGVTTGTTTKLIFSPNEGNPFTLDDYVTIENSSTVGFNTVHNPIISLDDSSLTIKFNSSSIVSPDLTSASVCRSVKVSCLTYQPSTFFNISEVVTLVSE